VGQSGASVDAWKHENGWLCSVSSVQFTQACSQPCTVHDHQRSLCDETWVFLDTCRVWRCCRCKQLGK